MEDDQLLSNNVVLRSAPVTSGELKVEGRSMHIGKIVTEIQNQ